MNPQTYESWTFDNGVLIYNPSGQSFDASHWTEDDWHDFCQDDHNRMANAEMMDEVAQ